MTILFVLLIQFYFLFSYILKNILGNISVLVKEVDINLIMPYIERVHKEEMRRKATE